MLELTGYWGFLFVLGGSGVELLHEINSILHDIQIL